MMIEGDGEEGGRDIIFPSAMTIAFTSLAAT